MEKNIFIDHYLDLRGLACPVNFVKCCLVLENLSSNQVLKVDLDIGEAETSIIDGLQEKGYKDSFISIWTTTLQDKIITAYRG